MIHTEPEADQAHVKAPGGQKRGPKRKLKIADWFEAALAVMGIGGVHSVRVDRLANDLGVTKGSFYVLFESRESFLSQLLVYWRLVSATSAIEELASIDEAPLERLNRILQISLSDRAKNRARIEAGFRLWAYEDKHAAETMAEIDRQRLQYFQTVCELAGLPAKEAQGRAFLIYAYIISDAMLSANQYEVRERCRLFLMHGCDAA